MPKPNKIGYTRRRDQLTPDRSLGYDTANAVLGLFSYLKYQGSDAQIDLTTIRLRIVEDRIEVTADDPRPPADPWHAPLDGIEVRPSAADRAARFGMHHHPETHSVDGDTHPVHECHPDRCGMWATQTSTPPTQISTPQTQARDTESDTDAWKREQAGRAARAKDHERGPWCSQQRCSQHEHERRTPLATPTPGGICPGCGADYDQTPTEACTTPERHDNPTPIATPTPPADQDTRPCCGRTECNSRGTRCPRWPDCP